MDLTAGGDKDPLERKTFSITDKMINESKGYFYHVSIKIATPLTFLASIRNQEEYGLVQGKKKGWGGALVPYHQIQELLTVTSVVGMRP